MRRKTCAFKRKRKLCRMCLHPFYGNAYRYETICQQCRIGNVRDPPPKPKLTEKDKKLREKMMEEIDRIKKMNMINFFISEKT